MGTCQSTPEVQVLASAESDRQTVDSQEVFPSLRMRVWSSEPSPLPARVMVGRAKVGELGPGDRPTRGMG